MSISPAPRSVWLGFAIIMLGLALLVAYVPVKGFLVRLLGTEASVAAIFLIVSIGLLLFIGRRLYRGPDP